MHYIRRAEGYRIPDIAISTTDAGPGQHQLENLRIPAHDKNATIYDMYTTALTDTPPRVLFRILYCHLVCTLNTTGCCVYFSWVIPLNYTMMHLEHIMGTLLVKDKLFQV